MLYLNIGVFMFGYIYKTIIKPTKEVYIGQTSRKFSLVKSYLGSGLILKRKINKYGRENCQKIILIEGIDNQKNLDFFEKIIIEIYKKEYKDKCINISDGGNSNNFKNMNGINHPMYGKHHTLETKLKISLLNKGKSHKQTKETKEKISNWHKNKILKDNTKIKLANIFSKRKDTKYAWLYPFYEIIETTNIKKAKTVKCFLCKKIMSKRNFINISHLKNCIYSEIT
jgi:hypothetical protein